MSCYGTESGRESAQKGGVRAGTRGKESVKARILAHRGGWERRREKEYAFCPRAREVGIEWEKGGYSKDGF